MESSELLPGLADKFSTNIYNVYEKRTPNIKAINHRLCLFGEIVHI